MFTDLPGIPREAAAALRVRAFGFDQDGQTIDRQWFTATTPPVLATDGADGYRYGYDIKAARKRPSVSAGTCGRRCGGRGPRSRPGTARGSRAA